MNRFVSSLVLVVALATAAHAGTVDQAKSDHRAGLPLVASDELGAPGRTLTLEGLVSDGARTTGLALANLGGSAARCTVSLTAADGTAIGELSTVGLAPRSHRYLDDVFAGLQGVTEAQAAVTCDQPFYAFAVIPDRTTGGVTVVDPTPLSKKAGATPCAAGSKALCFDLKGIVHQPTAATPVKRVAFPVPPGTYSRVKLSLDVTVGPWHAPDPDGKHLVYWFVLNRNFDMLGMLYFRGPAAYTALSRYGIGLTHPKKIKLVKPFKAVPGRTYRCENDLDMAAGVINITVTDKSTGEVVRLRGAANVGQLTAKAGDRFIVDMAFPENKVPDEVPAFGWTFRDVHIEAYPK
jgi:hypothetical protein